MQYTTDKALFNGTMAGMPMRKTAAVRACNKLKVQ